MRPVAAIAALCAPIALAAQGSVVESTAPQWSAAQRRTVEPKPFVVVGGADAAAPITQITAATRLADGRIVVADGRSSELRFFDATGKALRTVGRKGEGPGEFGGLAALFPGADGTVTTWDWRYVRLTTFDARGEVAGTRTVERPPRRGNIIPRPVLTHTLGDGTFLAWTGYTPTGDGTTSVVRIDTIRPLLVTAEGKLRDLPLTYQRTVYAKHFDDGYSTDGTVPFSPTGLLAAGPRSWFHSDGSRYEIREFSPEGKPIRTLRLKRTPGPVTTAMVAAHRRTIAATTSKDPGVARRAKLLSEWLTYPKVLPAFDALVYGRDGTLWARSWTADGAVQQWELFATSSGRWLGTVAVPAGIDVLEVGADYLLGRTKDADDVEMVGVYRIK